jgi:hypothetical protein
MDVHHLRAREITNVVALGGTTVRSATFDLLARLGFQTVSISLDREDAGRVATAQAVERAAGAARSPAVLVIDPDRLAPAKDPDAFVREKSEAWSELVSSGACGVTWRALEFVRGVDSTAPLHVRRRALAEAGGWLGSLPARLSLEQEDAITAVATRCGYSPEAATRSFKARFWTDPSQEHAAPKSHVVNPAPQL